MGQERGKSQFISDFKVKDQVEELFMIKYIAVMEARDGKNYLNLILTDSSGDLEARKWHGASDVAAVISKGDIVLAKGKMNQYQGRLQCIIQGIEKVDPNSVDTSDFLVKSETPPDKMYEDLLKIVSELDDVYIKDLLNHVLHDREISRRLKVWQAGKSVHHAYQGGLLEHILSCSQLAVTLSKHYKANVNYVVAGSVLHDLCKVYELSEGPVVEYTDEGKLVGHLVKGVELVDHFASKIKDFPHGTKMHLKHILISHHGVLEYGSPKLPQTSEAYLVHLIDYMDSKMNALEAVKKSDSQSGNWSGYVKHLDRIVFKGTLPHHSEYIPEREESKGERGSGPKSFEGKAQSANDKQKKKNRHFQEGSPNNAFAGLLSGIKFEEKK